MDEQRHGDLRPLPRALRALERRLGADREGRTLWVWLVPASTVVITFVVLAFLGVQGRVDLTLTVPMALVLSLFLGSLSAIYLTAASADERDKDDGPNDNGRPGPPPPQPPPADHQRAPAIVHIPSRPPQESRRPTPVGSGPGPRR